MPTSREPLVDNRFAKLFVNVCAAMPLLVLGWDAWRGTLGVNGVNYALRSTGMVGLVMLTLSLAITPIRRFVKWNPLIAIRRNVGVYGFGYIALHFAIFFWFDRAHDLGSTLSEIVEREYLWFGMGSLLMMIPLTVTSTDAMVSRLGGKRWKLLHRANYLIVLFGIIHFYLLVKADVTRPQAFLAVYGTLMTARVAFALVDRRNRRLAKSKPRAFWSGKLKVARITQETPDVKTFRFVMPDGSALRFRHVAGQYLNISLPIGDKVVKRSYTIASSPMPSYCEISVKRAKDGYASHYLHDAVKEGDLLPISAPAGKFVFAGHESERVVLLAGGVGITPMMSVVRALTGRNWKGDIYLLFANRTSTDIIFERELADLAARFPNLHVRHTLTAPDEAWSGARGRITAEMIRDFVPSLKSGPILVCGPEPMMAATRALLVGMGIPDAEILEEAFVSPTGSGEASGAGEAAAVVDGAQVRFAKSDVSAELPPDLTVLEAAEDAGVAIPFECRSGICGQCKCTLVSGKVSMAAQDALSPKDRSLNVILACQARAASANVVIDA